MKSLTEASAVKSPAKSAEFIASTWMMLNDDHTEIKWSSDGTIVIVANAEKLAEHVLPKYFSHGQYASWVRALNAYDFKKAGAGRWQHPSFLRGRPELLPTIRRKAVAPRVRGAAAAAAATSTALVLPEKPLLTVQQQQWQWMQAELSRLEGELLSVRREEFQQRFNFVRLMQILLKKGVAPTFLPAFKGMGKCKLLLEGKCKLLQLTKQQSPEPLSREAAAAMLQRAMRMRAVASSPRTTSTAVDDDDVASISSDDAADLCSLPSVPPSPSRIDVDLEELGLDYEELLRGGAVSPLPLTADEQRVVELDQAGGRWSAPTSSSSSTALCSRGAADVPTSGDKARCKQQCGALKFASVLASMPQLPASTAQLPPEGSRSRAQIENAIHLAFKQLTISADSAAISPEDKGMGSMLASCPPPLVPMSVC